MKKPEPKEQRKPVDFGEIKPPEPTRSPKRPGIPRILRHIVPWFDPRWSWEEEVRRYGLWELEATRSIGLGHGRSASPGDRFKMPGNQAIWLVGQGSAIFVDEKLDDEKKTIAELDRLGLDLPPGDNKSQDPAQLRQFQSQAQSRKGFTFGGSDAA